MEKFLAFDVETGGLDPNKASLLTAYFAVLDENFDAIDELSLEIKNNSENDQYHVSAKALELNRIDLVQLQKNGISVDNAKLKLIDLIMKHSEDGKFRLMPLGHNVNFDIGFVQAHLIPKEIWDKYVSYRLADTASFGIFLQRVKKVIPPNVRGDLKSLAKYFGIDVEKGDLHTAKFDTVVAVLLLQAMKNA